MSPSTKKSGSSFGIYDNAFVTDYECEMGPKTAIGSGCSSTVYACRKRNELTQPLVVKVSRLVDDQHLSLCKAEFELLKRLEENPGVVNVKACYVEI